MWQKRACPWVVVPLKEQKRKAVTNDKENVCVVERQHRDVSALVTCLKQRIRGIVQNEGIVLLEDYAVFVFFSSFLIVFVLNR